MKERNNELVVILCITMCNTALFKSLILTFGLYTSYTSCEENAWRVDHVSSETILLAVCWMKGLCSQSLIG